MKNTSETMAEAISAMGADSEDAVLLKSTALETIQRVPSTRGSSFGAQRSADAQAWTMGGNVD